jgi:hypothetical protein
MYNCAEETFYEADDLRVGGELFISGRVWHIVDCDPFTRETMPDQPPKEAYPVDAAEELRHVHDVTESGADQTISRGIRQNELKR